MRSSPVHALALALLLASPAQAEAPAPVRPEPTPEAALEPASEPRPPGAGTAGGSGPATAGDADASASGSVRYEFTVRDRLPVTASSTLTIPAEDFALRPLESGGQMLEAVPGLVTAQHTGGGKAEQYFVRGFDADHGTDLAVYFDGVPVNLRSHAHGQGFLDLHFVTKESIARLDAYKGPYFAQFGDFATAAAVEYVPHERLEESLAKFEVGEWNTFRWVAVGSPRSGPFAEEGPADALVSFEAYHTDGPFQNDENLWRYSAFVKAGVDLGPDLRLSGHGLGYWADWNASGLLPQRAVRSGLDRFGSVDPTEGGDTTRYQGKLQLDWSPSATSHLMANAYLSYYDFELFSNFTYFLDDPGNGDGIVQRDEDRVLGGGRVEYRQLFDAALPTRLLAGVETRFDHTDVVLGDQTRRLVRGLGNRDRVEQLSVEPYLEAQVLLAPWARLVGGLRFAWFRFDGKDQLSGARPGDTTDQIWLPKASLVLAPFGPGGPFPREARALRELELFFNFGIGYHSNDARAVFDDPGARVLPRATGFEAGLRTELFPRVELAFNVWSLRLQDEFVFVGDEGTTESAGESKRFGVEFVATAWLRDWLYLRGDVAWTRARLDESERPVAQAPRFVAKGALGVRHRGFAAELSVRSLGDRYASEDFYDPKLQGYAVLDFGMSYRWRFLEVGFAVENLTDTDWRSSEFYYESCLRAELGARPACTPAAGVGTRAGIGDFHFTPGNPRNFRGWVSAYF